MAKFNYQPIPSGLKEIGQSPAVQAACVSAAGQGLSFANMDDPEGSYEVRPAQVPTGWSSETRAGAILEETESSYEGARRRTLVRSVPIIEG